MAVVDEGGYGQFQDRVAQKLQPLVLPEPQVLVFMGIGAMAQGPEKKGGPVEEIAQPSFQFDQGRPEGAVYHGTVIHGSP